MSLFKKNKELLRKIYEEEFEKAEKSEQKVALNREIERIKKKAHAKAHAKYNKAEARAKMRKDWGKKTGGIKKRAKRLQKHNEEFMNKIMGW